MRDGSIRRILAGLITALVVGIGTTGFVIEQGRQTAVRSTTEQNAVVTAAAVTDAIDRVRREDDADVQEAVRTLTAAVPALEQIRVISTSRRQLVASTHPDDREAGDFPRRLQRDQKPWFDQAKELEAAHSTNVMEGTARKDEILKSVTTDNQLEVVLPLLTDGEVDGSVQVVHAPLVPGEPRRGVPWWLIIAAATLLLGGLLMVTPAGWPRFALGLVVAVAALWIHGQYGIDSVLGTRLMGEQAVAERALDVRDALRAVPGVEPERLQITDWNLDRYRAPRGTFDADGVVNAAVVREGFVRDRTLFTQAAVALGLLGLRLYWWVAAGWAQRTWSALVQHRSAYGFVVPAMIGMILLVFFPFFYGLALSFTEQTLYNVNQPLYDVWVGLQNYAQIITDFEVIRTASDGSRSINFQNFYWTLGFTVLWTVSNVTIGVTVGLALALILNVKGLRLKPMYRIILILPWAVPNYITALIWKGMFHKQFGVINQVLQVFGGEPVSWFDAWYTSFFAVLATNGWLSFPFMMVISLGALQAIPGDLYEAARVDGAGRVQAFRFVTLPSIKPALVPAIILSVVWTFNMFNIIYLVSQGEPAGATEILITDAYKIAFEQYRYGYAAAYSVVIFLVLMVYGIWQNRVTRATEGI
jgi:arabinogalactan oligomer/maltooligosaccharide transport system permease protein